MGYEGLGGLVREGRRGWQRAVLGQELSPARGADGLWVAPEALWSPGSLAGPRAPPE